MDTVEDDRDELEDVQRAPDVRDVPLDRVGVRRLRYPVVFRDADAPGAGSGRADGVVRVAPGAHTTGTFAVFAALNADRRGQHLSRFVEWVRDWAPTLSTRAVPAMLADLGERLDQPTAAGFRVDFPWFIERAAPETGQVAAVPYDVRLEGHWRPDAALAADTGHAGDPSVACTLSVRVPLTSLCPCSKAVSDFGAHNQRGYVDLALDLALRFPPPARAPAERETASRARADRSNIFDAFSADPAPAPRTASGRFVRADGPTHTAPHKPGSGVFNGSPLAQSMAERAAEERGDPRDLTVADVTVAEMIAVVEGAGSSPVYALLKRPDERHVTMNAYDKPAFVEDLARAALLPWRDDPRVRAARVRARTQESIHPHDAFAEASFTRSVAEDICK